MRPTISGGALWALWCLSLLACGGSGQGGGDAGRSMSGDAAAGTADASADVVDTDALDMPEAPVGPTGCAVVPCPTGQSCVHPACCPACNAVPSSGSCPSGSTLKPCPIGGNVRCVTTCTPAPNHCVPLPTDCATGPGCSCLATKECGSLGGTCSTLGDDLQCAGCF